MRLSDHFDSSEFACRCQREDCRAPLAPAAALISCLERLRVLWDHPITITSGLRCDYWNRFVGGKADSEHLTGEAADIACTNSKDRYTLLHLILSHGLTNRIGLGGTFLHLGISRQHPTDVVWLYAAGE